MADEKLSVGRRGFLSGVALAAGAGAIEPIQREGAPRENVIDQTAVATPLK